MLHKTCDDILTKQKQEQKQTNIIQGMVERKGKRGKPAASQFDDIKVITGIIIIKFTELLLTVADGAHIDNDYSS